MTDDRVADLSEHGPDVAIVDADDAMEALDKARIPCRLYPDQIKQVLVSRLNPEGSRWRVSFVVAYPRKSRSEHVRTR